MDDLLREAIADAKAVRETALENAKIALEEAFTPRLQSMLSKKIQSEMEDSEETEDSEEMNREMAEEESEDAEEMKMDAEEREDSEMGAEEMKMDADEMEMDAEEEMEDSEEMKMDAEEEMEDAEEMKMDAEEMEDKEEEDELDLESVLAELEADLSEEEDKDEEEKVDEVEDKDEEEKVDENDVSSDIGKSDNKVNPKANDSSATGAQGPEGEGKDEPAGNELDDHEVVKEVEDKEEDDDIDLDEVLKALSEEEDAEEEADKVEELKKEITETRNVVKFMRAKLNEVNLLNAKLLFSNKLFRAFGLNNNQKLKVVENFDRTKNLREVKLVYATLAESFKSPKKLSESVSKGSSSKPVASTKPANEEVLTEGNELKARFKKLANIL
jgi:hypothetical protein